MPFFQDQSDWQERLQKDHSHTAVTTTEQHFGKYRKKKRSSFSCDTNISYVNVCLDTAICLLAESLKQKLTERCLGAVLSCNPHRRLFYVTLNDCLQYTNSLWKKLQLLETVIYFNLITERAREKEYTDFDQARFPSWFCRCDFVLLCWFTLFSRAYWSLGKSPEACPPEEATISVWMRGYRTVMWKCWRGWLMESPGYPVISLWLSSPQIYRLLISASPTVMESKASSFKLLAIYAISFHYKKNAHTQPGGWNLSNFFPLWFSKTVVQHLRQEW